MLKDYLTKKGITKLLDKVRISGLTPSFFLTENKANTKSALKKLFKRHVMNESPADVFSRDLTKTIKARKRFTLNNLRNLMSGIRGEARNIQAFGRKGKWFSRGVLDSGTTHVCASYFGQSWDLSYADIPDKPPRIAEVYHPCRSFLQFVEAGETEPDERSFMDQFNDSEELQLDMLGKTRFDAFKSGELKITSFKDYEKSVLNTIEELGL